MSLRLTPSDCHRPKHSRAPITEHDERVIELRRIGLSRPDIARATGLALGSLHTVMKRLIAEGRVERIETLPVSDAPAKSRDGHRWEAIGRIRTCCDCGQRQYLAAYGYGLDAQRFVGDVTDCKRSKRRRAA